MMPHNMPYCWTDLYRWKPSRLYQTTFMLCFLMDAMINEIRQTFPWIISVALATGKLTFPRVYFSIMSSSFVIIYNSALDICLFVCDAFSLVYYFMMLCLVIIQKRIEIKHPVS